MRPPLLCAATKQLWPYVETVGEWERRLEERFEEFVSRALETGLTREEVEAEFSPFDAIWTPIRLRREMPTVEWRAPDATLPSELLRLLGDAAAAMGDVNRGVVRIEGEGERTDGGIDLPTFDALSRYVDRAIEEGLGAASVREYLGRMGFRVEEYEPLTHEFEGARVGPRTARELRLRYADRLDADVAALS